MFNDAHSCTCTTNKSMALKTTLQTFKIEYFKYLIQKEQYRVHSLPLWWKYH